MTRSEAPSISLVRIGDVSPETCRQLAERISLRIGLPCRISARVIDPDFAYDPRRGQYGSHPLLERLLEDSGAGSARILGIADVDLFMPILTFVFGEALLGGRAGVISMHRLRQTVYGLPDDPELTLVRTEREAVHELGHTFGLVHCPDYRCTMRATRSVEEIDLAGGGLCRTCGPRIAESVRGLDDSDRIPTEGRVEVGRIPSDLPAVGPPSRRRSLRSALSSLFPFLKPSAVSDGR